MTDLEVMKKEAVELTLAERDSLIQFLREQQAQDARTRQSETKANGHHQRPGLGCLNERDWLKENWAEYRGQYVCLEGNQLVSAGANHHQVYQQALAAGIKAPFMARVQDPNIEYLDGFTEI